MALSGLKYKSLLAAVDAGYLGDVQIARGPKLMTIRIETRKIRELAALIERTLSVGEVARSSGLSSRAVCKLVTAEVLPAARWSKAAVAARIEPEEFARSSIAKLQHAAGHAPTAFEVSLSRALVKLADMHGSAAVKTFVEALVRKQIPLYRHGAGPLLDRSYLDVRDLSQRFGVFARGKPVSH